MNRFLIRIVVFLLVPSLLVDPAMAASFSRPLSPTWERVGVRGANSSVYSEEALAAHLASFPGHALTWVVQTLKEKWRGNPPSIYQSLSERLNLLGEFSPLNRVVLDPRQQYLIDLADPSKHGALSKPDYWKISRIDFNGYLSSRGFRKLREVRMPIFVTFARYLLDRGEFKGKKLVFLGRGADLLYDAAEALVQLDPAYADRKNDLVLIDWSIDEFRNIPSDQQAAYLANAIELDTAHPMGIVLIDELAAPKGDYPVILADLLSRELHLQSSVETIVMDVQAMKARASSRSDVYAEGVESPKRSAVKQAARWLAYRYWSGRMYDAKYTKQGLVLNYHYMTNYGPLHLLHKVLAADAVKRAISTTTPPLPAAADTPASAAEVSPLQTGSDAAPERLLYESLQRAIGKYEGLLNELKSVKMDALSMASVLSTIDQILEVWPRERNRLEGAGVPENFIRNIECFHDLLRIDTMDVLKHAIRSEVPQEHNLLPTLFPMALHSFDSQLRLLGTLNVDDIATLAHHVGVDIFPLFEALLKASYRRSMFRLIPGVIVSALIVIWTLFVRWHIPTGAHGYVVVPGVLSLLAFLVIMNKIVLLRDAWEYLNDPPATEASSAAAVPPPEETESGASAPAEAASSWRESARARITQAWCRLWGYSYPAPEPYRPSNHNSHDTYLNRYPDQTRWLHENALAELVDGAIQDQSHRVEIWILGASTGEEEARLFHEVMTVLLERKQNVRRWSISIRGIEKDLATVAAGRERLKGRAPFYFGSEGNNQKPDDYTRVILSTLNHFGDIAHQSLRLDPGDIFDSATWPRGSPPGLILINSVFPYYSAETMNSLLEKIDRYAQRAWIAFTAPGSYLPGPISHHRLWEAPFTSPNRYLRYHFAIPHDPRGITPAAASSDKSVPDKTLPEDHYAKRLIVLDRRPDSQTENRMISLRYVRVDELTDHERHSAAQSLRGWPVAMDTKNLQWIISALENYSPDDQLKLHRYRLALTQEGSVEAFAYLPNSYTFDYMDVRPESRKETRDQPGNSSPRLQGVGSELIGAVLWEMKQTNPESIVYLQNVVSAIVAGIVRKHIRDVYETGSLGFWLTPKDMERFLAGQEEETIKFISEYGWPPPATAPDDAELSRNIQETLREATDPYRTTVPYISKLPATLWPELERALIGRITAGLLDKSDLGWFINSLDEGALLVDQFLADPLMKTDIPDPVPADGSWLPKHLGESPANPATWGEPLRRLVQIIQMTMREEVFSHSLILLGSSLVDSKLHDIDIAVSRQAALSDKQAVSTMRTKLAERLRREFQLTGQGVHDVMYVFFLGIQAIEETVRRHKFTMRITPDRIFLISQAIPNLGIPNSNQPSAAAPDIPSQADNDLGVANKMAPGVLALVSGHLFLTHGYILAGLLSYALGVLAGGILVAMALQSPDGRSAVTAPEPRRVPGLQIIPPTWQHIEKMIRLHRQLFPPRPGKRYHEAHIRAEFQTAIAGEQQPKLELFGRVAERSKQVVGLALCSLSSPRIALLSDLGVSPMFRRRGVATALLAESLAKLGHAWPRVNRVILYALPGSATAHIVMKMFGAQEISLQQYNRYEITIHRSVVVPGSRQAERRAA